MFTDVNTVPQGRKIWGIVDIQRLESKRGFDSLHPLHFNKSPVKTKKSRSSASSFLESKNTSKNVFFPILTFDLRNDLPSETASAGLKTLPESKLVVIGVGESSMNAKASKALVQRSPATPAKRTDAQALLVDLRELIVQARAGVARAVDSRLVTLYWHVGRRTS